VKTSACWSICAVVAVGLGSSLGARAADLLIFNTYVYGSTGTTVLTPNEAHFNAYQYPDGGDKNAVSLHAGDWTLELIGPNKTTPRVGFYPDAVRFPFQPAGQPGLDFYGHGWGNNKLSGYFNVLQAEYGAPGEVLAFAVDFTQFNENHKDNFIVGSFRFHSDVAVPEPIGVGALGMAGAALLVRHRRRTTGCDKPASAG
jgi:hypothetical protein